MKKEERKCAKILVKLFKLHARIERHIKKSKVGGLMFPVLLRQDINTAIKKLERDYPDMKPLFKKARRKIRRKQKSR